jgi:hypothetical protein
MTAGQTAAPIAVPRDPRTAEPTALPECTTVVPMAALTVGPTAGRMVARMVVPMVARMVVPTEPLAADALH